ncbi:MAG TPA: hypothetical protein VNZ58_08665 [Thermomicrobiales bacterium]|nr:hypothetical protein [Thermomicrobiales bacterium]
MTHVFPILTGLLLAFSTLLAPATAVATPATADNGCPPERSSADFLCPGLSDPSLASIEYVYSDRFTDAIAVKLTDEGMDLALTCTGAEQITRMVIDLYGRIPRSERSRDDIRWARAQMTDEIHAHAQLGQTPELLPTANPIEIDFPQYEGRYLPSLQGLGKLGEQILFGSVWACPQSG